MKTKVLSLIFMLAVIFQTKAIGSYKAGDKLTVLAKSGLTLRNNANSNGKKKTLIPFGSVVIVQTEGLMASAHQVEEFKGYIIKGHWVKVKFGEEEGWAFDGYLSSLMVNPDLQEAKGVSSNEKDAIDALYGQNSTRKGVAKESSKDNTMTYDQDFQDGTHFTLKKYDGGSQRILTFKKGITQEEAYLWGKSVWFPDNKVGSQKYNGNNKHIRVNGGDNDSKAMRVIPVGTRWEVHFDIAD
ncbi:MAG: hypothetical protein ACOYOA_01325 [Saprospiraceae bacterium]